MGHWAASGVSRRARSYGNRTTLPTAWMHDFAAKTGTPFFYEQKGERFGFGPPAFQQEMLAKLESGERLW